MSQSFDISSLLPYWDDLRRYVCGLCGNLREADEVVYESLHELYATIEHGKFDGDREKQKAWHFTFVRCRALDRKRRQKRQQGREEKYANAHSEEIDDAPLEKLILDEDVKRLHAALDQLSANEREVICLRLAEWSFCEIADLTGLPLGTVKSHATRGVRKLRQLLEEPDHVH